MDTVSATQKHDHDDLVLEWRPRQVRSNLAITALASVGGFIWLVLSNSLGGQVAGGFLFIVCGVITVGAISRIHRRAFISITEEGIEHPDMGLILWHDVTDVSSGTGAAGPQVTISVRDSAAYRRRVKRPVVRALIWLDGLSGRPLLTLPTNLLLIGADALVAEIEIRRR